MTLTAPDELEIGFVLVCAAIVFLMQAGFCLLESGLVHSKNSINVAVKNILDCSVTILLFLTFGFAMMFGTSWNGLIGDPRSGIDFNDQKLVAFLIFQLVFSSAAATIVSGAVAERIKLIAYVAIVFVVSGVVYPVFGHWAWGGTLPGTTPGWLHKLGFIDWAGGAVVHVVGGFSALAAAQVVGKRRNLADKSLTSGYSLTLSVLGVFILWFCWWGFNGGSGLTSDGRLPSIILFTNIGAVTGGLTAAAYSQLVAGRIEVRPLLTGVLAGLVAITAGCHIMSFHASAFCGIVGSLLAIWVTRLLPKIGIDDAVGAFPAHGVAGLWGVIAVGLFAPDSELIAGSRLQQIAVQGIGAAVAAAFSYSTVLIAMSLLKKFIQIRVSEKEEKTGLNVVEHGASNAVTDLVMEIDGHARSGDFSTGLEADPNSEVGQIAAGYNRVIQRVQSEISNHQETNRWLAEERLRMQSILDHAGVGIYELDPGGKIASVNARLLELLGYHSLNVLVEEQNRETETLFPWQKLSETNSSLLREKHSLGLPVKEIESVAVCRDGEERWVLESLVPIRDTSGNLCSWLGTMHDITEQKRASITEIEIAKAKSDAKGEFLASMSHEIRTPLNGVIGMLDLLASSDIAGKEKNFVSIAKSSAGTLLSLINDILDFSKIESGHMELESIQYNLTDLVEETAEQFAYHAHVKKLELTCEIANNLPDLLIGDPERLRQVLINLIGNAIKFTETGEINLAVTRRGSMMRVAVRDTGIGMNEETLETLFDSFTQADASTTRKYGGTGLGLTISSKLIGLMNGRLRAESTPDEGSEFWFEIQMQLVDGDSDLALDAPKVLRTVPQARVLIVDDNTTNCEILCHQLNNWGLNATVCKEPAHVIERMLVAYRIGKSYDLVILDFCMPGMNGSDVAIAIQNEPSIASIPIVLLSSSFELMSNQDMDSLGIFSAITKPARQSRLLDTILRALSNKTDPKENSNDPHRANVAAHPQSRTESSLANLEVPSSGAPTTRQQTETDLGHEKNQQSADVLIVEDNHVNRIVAQKILTELGVSTEFACDGQEGLEKVTTGNFGMVLMDGHMPVMDGLESSRAIRKWESTQEGEKRIPIVALTANVVQGIRKECKEAGMDHYLCKPITMAAMQTVVEKFLPGYSGEVRRKAEQRPSLVAETRSPTPASENLAEARSTPMPNAEASFLGGQEPTQPTASLTRRASDSAASASDSAAPVSIDDHLHEQLLSLEKLHEQLGGDESFAKQILQVMHETLPQQIEKVQAACNRNDFRQVASIAHQISGAAGDSCLPAVLSAAAELEKQALNEDSTSVPLTIAALSQKSLATIEVIESLIKLD